MLAGLSHCPPLVRGQWRKVPFKDWVLPASHERMRLKLLKVPDGDRHGAPTRSAIARGAPLMVEILGAVLTDGLPAVEAACSEALGEGSIPPACAIVARITGGQWLKPPEWIAPYLVKLYDAAYEHGERSVSSRLCEHHDWLVEIGAMPEPEPRN